MEEDLHIRPNMHTYASLLMAYEKSGDGDAALGLYEVMRTRNIRCSNHAYRYVVSDMVLVTTHGVSCSVGITS